MRYFLGVILVVVFGAFCSLLIADWRDLGDARGHLVEVTKAHEKLAKDNKALERNIEDLQKNPSAIERVAREKWHYCRPGEKIYYFSSRPDSQ